MRRSRSPRPPRPVLAPEPRMARSTAVGFFFVLLFWTGFVCLRYLRVFTPVPLGDLTASAVSAVRTHGMTAVTVLGLAGAAVLLHLILDRLSGRFRLAPGRLVIIVLGLATAGILALAGDRWLWSKALLFFGTVLLTGYGAVFLFRKLTGLVLPLWAGLLAGLVLAQYGLFTAGLLSAFRPVWALCAVLPLALLGVLELVHDRGYYLGRIKALVDGLGWPGLFILEALWLVLTVAFITACTPETRSDAIRCHVPYMQALVRDHALLPNFYWYSHLVPSPIQLLGAGGVLFLGEIGAKWMTWLLGLAAVWVLIAEGSDLARDRTAGLAAGFVFIATPFLWLWLTSSYYDLPMTAFCLAGTACLRRALVKGLPAYLLMAGFLFGFAALAKVNSLLLAASLFLAFLLLDRQRFLGTPWSNRGRTLASIAVFFAVVLPWLVLVWRWTGNPVFPLLNGFFRSPFITDGLMEAFGRQYRELFAFPLGAWDLLLWPWSMTFQTSSFCEYPSGFMGPVFLILFPVGVLALARRVSRTDARPLWALFLAGLLYLGGCTLLLQAPYLRYWMPGLAILFLVLTAAFVPLLSEAGATFRPRVRTLAAALMVLFCLAFTAVSWTRAFKPGEPDRLGISLYRGQVSRDEFLAKGTGGVYAYVNPRLAAGESVLAVDYQYLNTLDCRAVQIMPWYDPVIGLHTLGDFDRMIEKEKVRYWIVADQAWPEHYARLGVAGKYWTREARVFQGSGFSVYEVSARRTGKGTGKNREGSR